MERDGGTRPDLCPCYNFNSHAHVEHDDGIPKALADLMNFNSHAHVERDDALPDIISAIIISTHTLTWSVTFHAAER